MSSHHLVLATFETRADAEIAAAKMLGVGIEELATSGTRVVIDDDESWWHDTTHVMSLGEFFHAFLQPKD